MVKNKIIIYSSLILLILGIINDEYFRPKFGSLKYLNIVFGSLPNFVGAFLFALFSNGIIPRKYREKKEKLIYLSALLVFIILTKEEFYPYFTATKTFDTFDIVASGLGVLFAIFIWKLSIINEN